MIPIVLMMMLSAHVHVKITDTETREAQQWLGPEMTAAEVLSLRAWQDRIREKYGVSGEFWLDVNRDEIVPIVPRAEIPWRCREVVECREVGDGSSH